VDLVRPAPEAAVGPEVLAELGRGVAILARLAAPAPADELLDRFRRDFAERYGRDREVPLAEALDEESGIGFDRGRGADVSPLLEGLDLPAPEATPRVPWGEVEQRLAARLGAALAAGATAIDLADADLAGLGGDDAPPLSDAFEVLATVAARSPEALAAGDFRVLLRGVYGPCGGRLMARFCDADPDLEARVRALLSAEEALEPDAIFAEIVHLPEGRIGNILSRPVLRGWEIAFLGRGGAPPERRLPLADLLVTVSGDRVVLRSASTGRRVLPRLTNAHNFSARGMGVYRFLAALQSQGVRAGLGWRWGLLEAFPFLPRVTAGRLVLARARWAASGDEIAALDRRDDADRYAAVRAWRERRGVPRWAVLPDGDNELVVDLDNPLAVDAFLGLVRGRPRVQLAELFPAPDELCATGPAGRFAHELLVPFVRRREPTRAAAPPPPLPAARSFPPGSEWLYVRLYTGTATADRVLRHAVDRVVRPALAAGAADRWFFLRYGDPDWHLRLRLHGDPRRLAGEVLPALDDALAPLAADGQVWKVELGTYEREVERYGGPAGVALCERLFEADSEAAVAVLDLLAGDASADVVWRLALAGLDRLLADLRLDGETALSALAAMQAAFAREHRADAALKKRMSARLRREQAELDRLLDAGDDPGHPLAPALAAFVRRSAAAAPVVDELARGVAAGRVTRTLAELAPSLAHMTVNRLLRSDARAHELVL
ncbi:MAG TPA: lantibiotic dehydratase, partial [Thermoanaerobaculia bacterium]|nr:lantibiotic dehydratase [Thermoanaerobaculia bacterium]